MGDYLRGYKDRKEDFDKIRQMIADKLKNFPDFNGVDFADVRAGGIQICGKHKQIRGFYYSGMPTINYDFSNINEAVDDFVEKWKQADNPTSVEVYKKLIADCTRWGWD